MQDQIYPDRNSIQICYIFNVDKEAWMKLEKRVYYKE